MRNKTRVAILFGGRSAEHEVSIQSAKNVARALDKNKYELTLIGIDKKGKWYLNEVSRFLLESQNPQLLKLNEPKRAVALVQKDAPGQLVSLHNNRPAGKVDVVFPVLHGPYGEDGTVQGLLKLMGVPFVGAGVLGSALGMDKDAMKRLLNQAGIPTARFVVAHDPSEITFEKAKKILGLPLFVKPANLGSSVGVRKARNKKEFRRAVKEAFGFDRKILIEEYVQGREIECSVLGNENPIASLPGEVIPRHEFYSYDAKYIDPGGAELKIPADLPKPIIKKVQKMAVQAFKTLCCEGMARVDFFLTKNSKLFVNEINTIPGFTSISMYPKLWEASGISYAELIDRLIQLALERYGKEKKLQTSYQ